MTNERSLAYGRVIKLLEDVGPAKLHDLERQRIRHAADALLFATPNDPGGLDELTAVEQLLRQLVDSGRWTTQRANELSDEVAACGPAWIGELPVVSKAA
jgi:hypothetical protein